MINILYGDSVIAAFWYVYGIPNVKTWVCRKSTKNNKTALYCAWAKKSDGYKKVIAVEKWQKSQKNIKSIVKFHKK